MKINPRTRSVLAALGCYQDGVGKNVVNGKPVVRRSARRLCSQARRPHTYSNIPRNVGFLMHWWDSIDGLQRLLPATVLLSEGIRRMFRYR